LNNSYMQEYLFSRRWHQENNCFLQVSLKRMKLLLQALLIMKKRYENEVCFSFLS
jgi:hypothetical protein